MQQLADVLDGAAEDGARAALDDGALDQFRVLDHRADEVVVGVFVARQIKLAVGGLALAEQLARRQLHLLQQLAQLALAYRRDVVVDLLEINAALTEQPVGLAALRSSRLLVDGDPVVHVAHSFAAGKKVCAQNFPC